MVGAQRSLRARLEAWAQEHGISLRIADARVDANARERMIASFERGDFTTWGYDRRYAATASDPENILAGARSVICVGVPYATRPPRRAERGRGRVSNYAWSPDYHRAMQAMLRDLAGEIDAWAQAPVTRVACDTAPLAERAYAERAGLGWIGKHTLLIDERRGSFVFLGEIVTTLELDPDPPSKKTCGACARCVATCPTGALRGDYTIDATRCISDLTQRTDSIPRALRPLVGDWVWGCDLCQDVCPPTRMRAGAARPAFEPRDAEAAAPALQRLLRMRASGFRRTFAPTAMGWRGPAVLRRNAAVALGNGLDRADVPVLLEALAGDPHPMVRGHVAWALGRIGSPRARAGLRDRLDVEAEASVREEILCALSS
jgi:epoxyqueuosine reductase